jgi:cobalt-zinc-cadmium efflux system protein
LIVAIMAAEIAAGAVAHSLALLTDAGHMLADAGALAFSLVAMRVAVRPARGAMTFGLRRVEIFSAFASGVTLLVIAGFVGYEGIVRLFSPPHVRAGLVLAVAVGGLLVNVLAARILAGGDRSSLNLEGSFQHVLIDAYGFAGTALAAGVILLTGFDRADPIASLLIAALMVRSGYGLVKASTRIFLEAAPAGIDPQAVGAALVGLEGVVEVHDLHIWEITSGFPALSAHVLVAQARDCHEARRSMETLLHERFALDHTTLQVDHVGSELLTIAPPAVAPPG